jgi:hypothetical protein
MCTISCFHLPSFPIFSKILIMFDLQSSFHFSLLCDVSLSLQQSDLVHNGEFVPGYSSFLFNQLLQTQFYSVNHGARSINLNIAKPLSPSLSTIPDHPNIPRAVLVEEHITPILSPRLLPQQNVNNTSNTSNNTNNNSSNNDVHKNNKNANNNVNNNNNNSIPTNYKSTVFQQALADQQKKYNRTFEREVRGHVPVYPEIDLLEFFGEREIVKRNRRRLQSTLYSTKCNLGTHFSPVFPSPHLFSLLRYIIVCRWVVCVYKMRVGAV